MAGTLTTAHTAVFRRGSIASLVTTLYRRCRLDSYAVDVRLRGGVQPWHCARPGGGAVLIIGPLYAFALIATAMLIIVARYLVS